jgi:uncharacterized protein with FMN-binding domain
MKFKKVLIVTIMATSMVALVACGGAPEDDATLGINENPASANTYENEVVEPDQTVAEPEQNDNEVVAKDGIYTGIGYTTDEKGQIQVELTIIDNQAHDIQVISQDGIEIPDSTIEGFRNHLLNNQPIDEITGDKEEINLLIEASIEAFKQSI